ncbi:hypothetical protein HYW75_05115 [Candidatus Pacearchaeota archaeon]|nr:hypothetical protein [Candidatus Pacearchaeota archaeon]
MVKIALNPGLARLLISQRESEIRDGSLQYIEKEIQEGRWKNINPIWLTPNFLINGLFSGILSWEWHPTLKPLIIYNGYHRLKKGLEHSLPIVAYIRYSPFNPKMPEDEILIEDINY